MAMTITSQSTELALRALAVLAAREPGALVDLLAESAVMDFPYAPEGFAQRLEGRNAIVDGLSVVPQIFTHFEITPRKVMANEAGEVVIEAYGAATLQDGSSYRNSYVMIFEIRDSQITRWSEYHNPLKLPRVAR